MIPCWEQSAILCGFTFLYVFRALAAELMREISTFVAVGPNSNGTVNVKNNTVPGGPLSIVPGYPYYVSKAYLIVSDRNPPPQTGAARSIQFG